MNQSLNIPDKLLSPFDFPDYKSCLAAALATTGAERGKRARLARFLGCQPAFVSQLVNRSTHISLEHAYGVCLFLQFSEQETVFFLAMVQHARAGTQPLRSYYDKQLTALRRSREQVQSRLAATTEVSAEESATYYSSWHYQAIHVMTSIPKWQSPLTLAEQLGLPFGVVKEYLDFLLKAGLVTYNGGRYSASSKRIHLGATNPLIAKHHTNWRLRAILDLDRRSEESLHFSAAVGISEHDAKKIKELLLKAIADQERIMGPSSEEAAFGLCLDFFRL